VTRASRDFGKWAAQAAQQAGALFIPLNEIISDHYDKLGEGKVSEFFTATDHTHTTLAGAKFNATCVANGTKALKDCTLKNNLVEPQK
jgi:rhamnogalacturonan acetylesterase